MHAWVLVVSTSPFLWEDTATSCMGPSGALDCGWEVPSITTVMVLSLKGQQGFSVTLPSDHFVRCVLYEVFTQVMDICLTRFKNWFEMHCKIMMYCKWNPALQRCKRMGKVNLHAFLVTCCVYFASTDWHFMLLNVWRKKTNTLHYCLNKCFGLAALLSLSFFFQIHCL